MIPVNEPIFGEREKELLCQCIDTGWISSEGPFVKQFEEMFADYVGVVHGVAVANGTAALDVAVGAIGLNPGDEVILPTFTIISCVLAVIRNGGIPILVDVESDTWCMDVSLVEAEITPRTKAIMPVHMYGHPVDMDPLLDLANKYKLYVIEDAAEAHGAEYKGQKCGSLGHIAAFSFYANKIITTGEGGMVVTNDPDLAKRARSFRNLCFRPEKRFYHTEIGFNYRMTNLQAAVGVAQLERIEEFVEIKRHNARYYNECLKGISKLQLPVERDWAKNVYWMYGVVFNENLGLKAEKVMRKLAEKGIQTRPFFYPMHLQPAFRSFTWYKEENLPVSERLYEYGFYLPSGLTLTEEHIGYVVNAINEILV